MTPRPANAEENRQDAPDDGTRQLLQWGGSMVGAGLFCVLLLVTVLGGYSRTGASTNAGWFALIVALMCLPFGGLLLLLGFAKWLRNVRERSDRAAGKHE
ncbi:MAG: hypothetical protein ABR957_11555 [Terracidiphilus sp.]|jgi:hypothetical protein